MSAQKKFICEEAIHLKKVDKIDILKMISRLSKEKIKESSDGCRINLDLLSEEMIMQIYNLMCRRLGLEKKF